MPTAPTSSTILTSYRSLCRVLAACAVAGCSQGLLAQSRPATPAPPATTPAAPARPAAPRTPPATPPATTPAAPAQGEPAVAPSGEEEGELPEGLKVRDPGTRPDFKGGPAIYFTELDHDFGKMTNAETKHHRFEFVNAGDQPLTIQNVVPKCSCTRPSFERGKTYQPGEKGYIDVDFTPPTGGHQAKAIVVQSNAAWPSNVFNIRVIGKVASVLTFEPKTLDFGEIRRGQAWEGEVKIVADAKATIFDSVTSRNPVLTGTFVGTAPYKGEVAMKLTIANTVPWGSFRSGIVMIATRGKNEEGNDITKSLPFRVLGVVVDEIRASEYLFQMDTVRPGNSFSKSIFVYHESGKPIELGGTSLEPMPFGTKGIAPVTYHPLEVKEMTKDGKTGYLLTVSGDTPGDAHGFMSGAVKFKARAKGEGEYVERELPIGGRVMTEEAEKSLPTNRGR